MGGVTQLEGEGEEKRGSSVSRRENRKGVHVKEERCNNFSDEGQGSCMWFLVGWGGGQGNVQESREGLCRELGRELFRVQRVSLAVV